MHQHLLNQVMMHYWFVMLLIIILQFDNLIKIIAFLEKFKPDMECMVYTSSDFPEYYAWWLKEWWMDNNHIQCSFCRVYFDPLIVVNVRDICIRVRVLWRIYNRENLDLGWFKGWLFWSIIIRNWLHIILTFVEFIIHRGRYVYWLRYQLVQFERLDFLW